MQEPLLSNSVCTENLDGLDRNLKEGSDYAVIANDECDRSATSFFKQGKRLVFLFLQEIILGFLGGCLFGLQKEIREQIGVEVF